MARAAESHDAETLPSLCPLCAQDGDVKVTVGCCGKTLTVTEANGDVPPKPEQETQYVTGPVWAWPAAVPPVTPPVLKLVPVQLVAPLEDQVMEGVPP